ncbi:TonB-dependent receptor domain-containing protein [Brucella rhizosphaerae]|uniref:TonB-dependent receptor domain-containing protein n=1 Tax=Brucella rhizosphaerae TaxID=571254 RepID=UPI000B981B47|nr:TonB-dependent receptor [Brucella rhizosphaerae]
MTSLFRGLRADSTQNRQLASKSLFAKAFLAGTCLSTALILSGTGSLAQTTSAEEEAAKKKQAEVQAAEQVNADGGIKLNQIVVSATGFEQNITDAPASISVVPGEELEKGVYRDLTDALKGVQGVAVTGPAAERDIFIRGLPGSYTLILVDGKRQSTRDARTNGNSGFEQSFLPPANAIERIEVIRGPMSSLYGSDAMGGVINVITKKVADKWSGSISVDTTLEQHSKFGNSLQGSYYLTGPLVPNLVGVQVWGRGLKRQEDQITSGTPEQRDVDITGRVTITPNEDHDIMLEMGKTKLRRDSTVGNTASSGTDAYNLNDRTHWSISHTGRWGPTTSDFSFMQETAERTNFNWNAARATYDENLRSPHIRNSILDGKFTTPFELYGNHTLVTGGQFIESVLTDQNPGNRTGLDEEFSVKQWALFAEDEWWLTSDFALTGGLRMDHHEIYGAHWSPRGYAVWHATEQLTFKGGISTGFRAPEIRTIAPGYAYTTGGAGCSYGPTGTCGVILGAPGLQPEKSTSYEASVLWDNQSGLRLGATYFYTDFKDKIANELVTDPATGLPARWEQDPNYRLWRSFNIDDAVMQGVELTADWEVTDTITLRGNYTYTDSEQKTGTYAGLPLARTPKHMASLRGDWETPVDGLKAWAAGNYHGEETNAGARIGTAGTPVYAADGRTVIARKYKGYATFDLGGSYDFSEHVTLNAAVYNLFDKKIGVDEFNNVVEGRRLWLGMTSRF